MYTALDTPVNGVSVGRPMTEPKALRSSNGCCSMLPEENPNLGTRAAYVLERLAAGGHTDADDTSSQADALVKLSL